jgi:adenylosuccinate lyase
LLAFMLRDLTWVLDGLVVYPDRMRANLDADGGLAYSQSVLLALIEAGCSRDEAYAIVQRAAAAAWDEGRGFREALQADPDVTSRIASQDLADLFRPERFLRNLGGVFERLEKLPVEEEGTRT